MFKDYYSILDINEHATAEEIKAAFRKKALLWHPDINNSNYANIRMQEINEAYIILNDKKARQHYDIEYQRYKKFKEQFQNEQSNYGNLDSKKYTKSDYKIYDTVLNDWINNARHKSKNLARVSIEELAGMTTAGLKAAVRIFQPESFKQIGCFLFIILIIIIFILIGTIS